MTKKQQKNPVWLGWSMWFIAAIFYALDYFQHTAPSVLIQPIANGLHKNITEIGDIMSLYFPFYALSQIPAGVLLDKYGVKWVLAIACVVVSVGLYIMRIPSELTLVIGRVFIALGSAFAFLGALKTASNWLPKSIFPIAVGLVNTIGVVGGILGKSLLNYLIVRFDWEIAILFISVFGLLWACVILFFLRSSPQSTALIEDHKGFHWRVLTDKNIWLLALYAGIMVGTVVNAFSELYDVVFLQSSFHLSSETAALVSSMMFVGIAVGGPSHGLIVRYFTYKKTWMSLSAAATFLCFTLVVCANVLHLSYLWLYGLYFLTGFFVSSMLLSFTVARCCYPLSAHATIFALINTVIGLSGFLFQLLLGEFIHYFSGGKEDFLSQDMLMHSLEFILVPLFFSVMISLRIRKV